MAEASRDDARICQLAIDLVVRRLAIQYPQYQGLGALFKDVCKEEAYEELELLEDDLSQGFAESVILETISDLDEDKRKFEFKDADKEPLCSFLHDTVISFTPPPTSLDLAKLSIKVTDKELEEMKKIVEEQAILLKPDSAKDETLLKLLIIGKKHFFPLLTYLIDLYGRYRLLEYQKLYDELNKIDQQKKRKKFIGKKFKNVMGIPQFVRLCPSLRKLRKKKEKQNDANSEHALELYEASMNSFFRRLYGPLRMAPSQMNYKINDSILVYARYYMTLLVTVNNILKNDSTKLPLQIDFWVIPKAMTCVTDDDDDKSDDDDSDDDSEDSNEDDDHHSMNINNLKERLKYTDNLVNVELTNKLLPRTTFSKVIEDVIKDARSKRMVMIVDRRINKKDIIENAKNYSHKAEAEEKQENDQLYGFLTKKSQNIPNGQYLHEALFNLSRTEVLPKAGKKDNHTAIHAISSLPNLCLLSVQIHETTEVSAYWFMNGSGARFYVNDMVNIWPLYFIEKSKDEQGYIVQQDVNPIIDLIQDKSSFLPLQDTNFDTFFEQNTQKSTSHAYYKKLTKKTISSD